MTDRSSITAVIPAAGPVPDGVLALSNLSSSAMIPVAGRPLVQWTMGYLLSLGIERFVIAVRERGLFVEEFVDCVFGADCEVRFVVPSGDRGLANTVRELADAVETPSTLVVLGDTHFQFVDPDQVLTSDHPVVLVNEVDESYRWCIAELGDDGVVKGLRDKEVGLSTPLNALIGVYFFPDSGALRRTATDVLANTDGRVELSAVLDRFGEASSLRSAPAAMWLDCGNPDRQVTSQRALLEQRAFNELTIDSVFGTITKRSQQREKFIDEINYLRLLPNELAVLFPRVIDYSTDWADPYLTMEFYGYPTLAELFVFENVDAGIWRGVFDHLAEVIDQGFRTFSRPMHPGATNEMLLGKARQRLAAIDGDPAFLALLERDEPLLLNGRQVRGWRLLEPALEDDMRRLAATAEASVIHGDLCFSNILLDLRSGIFKFIDPRGSYGTSGVFGDIRYDIAKLFHSVHGMYDFMTADLFRVAVHDHEATLDVRSRPYHLDIRDQFEDCFFGRFERRDILLMTGLIFLGLPALHYDHPDRQLAFYLRGLELIEDALAEPPAPEVA